ncbi:coat protein [Striga asiatica]|uniref:Coat protein n=1 Tax=Striga asiatica TaxID=4170 RepID=A0A5A7PMA5_STRAF|nr:coat protein [Striga asiatica]
MLLAVRWQLEVAATQGWNKVACLLNSASFVLKLKDRRAGPSRRDTLNGPSDGQFFLATPLRPSRRYTSLLHDGRHAATISTGIQRLQVLPTVAPRPSLAPLRDRSPRRVKTAAPLRTFLPRHAVSSTP